MYHLAQLGLPNPSPSAGFDNPVGALVFLDMDLTQGLVILISP
jgi:hypothetical protein